MRHHQLPKKIYWVKIYRNKMQIFCKIGMNFFFEYIYEYYWKNSFTSLVDAASVQLSDLTVDRGRFDDELVVFLQKNKYHEKINWDGSIKFLLFRAIKKKFRYFFLLKIEQINHEITTTSQKYKWLAAAFKETFHMMLCACKAKYFQDKLT